MICPPQLHTLPLLVAHHVIPFPLFPKNNQSEEETLSCPSTSSMLSSMRNLAWVPPPRIHWVCPRGGTHWSNYLCHPDVDGVHFCFGPCTIRVSAHRPMVQHGGSFLRPASRLLFFKTLPIIVFSIRIPDSMASPNITRCNILRRSRFE